ncbi:ergothioneine biosynthesis protein EgtB [Rhodococcus sp. RCBS9]|uniref:ergothioneine biosynthesis protein EgtB n=1 Tax=Rhodococcus sp. RCBS9 TaxID=3031999 RepID=UPI002402B32A|nr:ergothioneine biosynthesis protein EgtB [Rhodococcus sp. RCBS9]WEX04533.1 ergothioneine biosynthesis protein EgtB [Rhodococcus sp. RCBS9]
MTGEITKEAVEAVLLRARERSTLLTDCVDDTELVAQHSPLMSPLVWDLAHIGNQEELWLVRDVGGRDPVRSDIDELYDAFKHSRSSRPTLPLLNPAEAREYVRTVRGKVWDVLEASTFGRTELDMDGFAFGMIAQHEQQHAETMLATHQLRSGPTALVATPAPQAARMPELDEVTIPAGPFVMGTDDEPWALDNERTAHQVYLTDFAIDRFPVTNGQFVEFIEDGGYSRPELWSRDGWRHRVDAKLRAPLFWERDSSGWWHETFGVEAPVPPDKPVVHVSFYEAEAYACWAGKRLPTEAEWEKAARWDPESGRSRRFPWGDVSADEKLANLGQRHLGPAGVGSYPVGASAAGVEQLIGDVWEWTSSGFHPYPGFRAFPYREYSEVFFGGDYKVLRGGSFGTDSVACRGTFRNWDHPIRRQIFSGFRCARTISGRS